MIKIVFLVAVIAVVGSKAPTAFHSFNNGGTYTSDCTGSQLRAWFLSILQHTPVKCFALLSPLNPESARVLN
jgi:hypothetical protein